jgi:hypothetical protein
VEQRLSGRGGHCNRKNLVPASLNVNLGDAAVLLFFLFHDRGCAYLRLQMKAIKPNLTLLMSSSDRFFIFCSPQEIISNKFKKSKIEPGLLISHQ